MNANEESASSTPGAISAVDKTRLPRGRGVIISSIILCALLIAVGDWLVDGGDLGDEGEAASTPQPTSTGPPEDCQERSADTGVGEPESAPSAGGVEVAETGIVLDDEGNFAGVGYGAVLENTSDLVAKDVSMTFTAEGSDGAAVVDRWTAEPWKEADFTVPYILPGQEFGLGDRARFVTEDRELDPELHVDVEVSQWWALDNDEHHFADISAQVEGLHDVPNAQIKFTADSRFCEAVGQAAASAVFRDDAGQIIGGHFEGEVHELAEYSEMGREAIDEYEPGASGDLLIDDYWSLAIAESADFDTELDLEQTEIYPYTNQ